MYRLAENSTKALRELSRKGWDSEPAETLSHDDLIRERCRGIRLALGDAARPTTPRSGPSSRFSTLPAKVVAAEVLAGEPPPRSKG